MGQQNKILIDAFGKSASNLIEHQADQDADRRVNDNKGNIIEYRVPGYYEGIGSQKKVTKVIESNPGTLKNTQPEINPLEGDYKAKHGEIVIDQKVKQSRQHHTVQRRKPD
jgi:hypothetical protein